MEILILGSVVGGLFLFSCGVGCCVRSRVRVLEERVAILEQRPLLVAAMPPPPSPQYYTPLPSAPVAIQNWSGPDLERGVRVV